jgi:hypothetical protein
VLHADKGGRKGLVHAACQEEGRRRAREGWHESGRLESMQVMRTEG